MGAAQYPAGNGPAGEDPLPALTAPRNVQPPAALLFDGASRAFPLDANGLYRAIHPVDQRVALALLIALGTVGSAPSLGSSLRAIRRIVPTTPTDARNRIDVALSDLVAARDIEVTKVEVETRRAPTGSLLVAVSYRNLRLSALSSTPTRIVINGS